MTPLQQLRSILNETYVSDDGEDFKIDLKPGLTNEQIDKLAHLLPTKQIPADIRDLLQFTSGFDFLLLDGVTFDGVGQFGFEEIFPNTVQLAGDGAGNFWIVDVDDQGNWNNVFFVCHDPAVVVKHSHNLAEFIKHIAEYGRNGSASHMGTIQEVTVMDIWRPHDGFIDVKLARNSGDEVLSTFAAGLPDHFVIADLRHQPNKAGFAWGKFGANTDNAVRHGSALLWGFEKQGKAQRPAKKGFFSKLFGR